MTNDTFSLVSSPIFQYGFAGLSVILLGMIIWLIKEILTITKDVTNSYNANSEALRNNNKLYSELKQVMIDIKDDLLKRPCVADSVSRVKI